MPGRHYPWRRWRNRILGGLAAPALLALASEGSTQPVPTPAAVTPAEARPLDLRTCRQIALERQPAVAAAHASLAAAIARSEALDRLHVPSFLARDLPTRRKQAALGVTIAQAGVANAEGDTLFGVTYAYLATLYARQQLDVADNAIADLKNLEDLAREIVKGDLRKDVTNRHVEQIATYVLVAQGRREDAVEGVHRARAALREAMGVGTDFSVRLPDVSLDKILPGHPTVDHDQIVALAVARRGEVAQTGTAAQVVCLEINAQKALLLPNARTFASGSDVHAQPVPAGSYGAEYKPGALALEMPPMLPGGRSGRIEQAQAYHARAEAMAEKTRNLIVLEAEEAFYRWREASKKAVLLGKAADAAEKLFKDLRAGFDPRGSRVTLDEVLNAGVTARQVRVQANEARYQELLALAALERATVGGFCAGFEGNALSRP
jgi:outer membrane protein TolC